MLPQPTTSLSGAGGPWCPNCQWTCPARVRSSDFVRLLFLCHSAFLLRNRLPAQNRRLVFSDVSPCDLKKETKETAQFALFFSGVSAEFPPEQYPPDQMDTTR